MILLVSRHQYRIDAEVLQKLVCIEQISLRANCAYERTRIAIALVGSDQYHKSSRKTLLASDHIQRYFPLVAVVSELRHTILLSR